MMKKITLALLMITVFTVASAKENNSEKKPFVLVKPKATQLIKGLNNRITASCPRFLTTSDGQICVNDGEDEEFCYYFC